MHCSKFPQQVRKCLMCVYVYRTDDSLSRKGFDWWMQILTGEILRQACHTLSLDVCPEATQSKPQHARWKSKGVLWSSSQVKPAGLSWPQDVFRLKPRNERASSPTLKGGWPQGWWHQRVRLQPFLYWSSLCAIFLHGGCKVEIGKEGERPRPTVSRDARYFQEKANECHDSSSRSLPRSGPFRNDQTFGRFTLSQ